MIASRLMVPALDDSRDAPLEETSRVLLLRARAGDEQARDRLCARYLPRLKRWARGRLPRGARDELDTDDVVQDTLLRTLRHLDHVEAEGAGALGAYLRRAILNRMRDEARRVTRLPPLVTESQGTEVRDPSPSPLEAAIGRQALARYEAALARLADGEREAILARLELDCPYSELAAMLGKPSADAARMAVRRALVRLAQEMSREEPRS